MRAKLLENLHRVMYELSLNDDKFGFTWHCKTATIFSRLDFWLIHDHLVNNTNTVNISPSINSDHKIIHLSLKTAYEKLGPSCWKFNASLLKYHRYVATIKKVIAQSAIKYFSDKNIESGNLLNGNLSYNYCI